MVDIPSSSTGGTHVRIVPSTLSLGATNWTRELVNVCTVPDDATLEGGTSFLNVPPRHQSTSLLLLPLPVHADGRPQKRCPLAITLALGPGLLICTVGFLAWGVPFNNLTKTVTPLAMAIRVDTIISISTTVSQIAHQMRIQALEQRMKWNVAGQPADPWLEAPALGRLFYPILAYNPNVIATPVIVIRGGCVLISILQQHPQLGWVMDRQNCSEHWLEGWDNVTQVLTGKQLLKLPLATMESALLLWPASGTTPMQPFTWICMKYNPLVGNGDVLGANVGLFDPRTGVYIGRLGLTMSTVWMRHFLVKQLRIHWSMDGGRAALIDEAGLVIAASHGVDDSKIRLPLSGIGDPDLEQAGRVLMQLDVNSWCPTQSMEVRFSTRYFLHTELISDPEPTVQPLEWCILLLCPRNNTMEAVDHSMVFATTFVCIMTFGITILSFLFGVMVTRPLLQLTNGMRALKQCRFTAAWAATGRKSCFSELGVAQESYDSLVETIDAFGKYVPQMVVNGLLDGTVRPELGMSEKTVAVAFMDIEQFTTMCEVATPDEIVSITSKLFDKCCHIILTSHGTINKFLGDCIMALWGAPVVLPLPGRNAVEAVIDILAMLRDEPLVLSNGSHIGLRIGLHGGPCLVGNFGATNRWDYTAIGDVVNVAARLEPLNKQFGTHCLTTGNIYDQLNGAESLQRCMRSMGDVLLVGKHLPVRVYEIQDSFIADPQAWGTAVEEYKMGHLDHAAEYFATLPGDPAAVVLLDEIQHTPANVTIHVRVMKGK